MHLIGVTGFGDRWGTRQPNLATRESGGVTAVLMAALMEVDTAACALNGDIGSGDHELFLLRHMVNHCILDVVFEIHRRLRESDDPLREFYEDADAAAKDHDAAAAAPKRARHEEVFSQPPALDPSVAENMAFNCCHCGQRVGATRYAQHLDKCMGKGGRRCTREKRTSVGAG